MATILVASTLILLVYTAIGYPVLLYLLARLFPHSHQQDEFLTPDITLVISAYNEEQVIAEKLNNALELDYPKTRLTILVVSDCSQDSTDEQVRQFADRGVKLIRTDQRRGKTAGLNLALEQIQSGLVVFSDANALYDRQALRKLARHFSDSNVGYVVGHARYRETAATSAGISENGYWNIEVALKRWESDFSSVVGGDGAIYAIRRELYEPLQTNDINDFVNPLQIIAKGYRGIFDPEAWCLERPAGRFNREFARKVRIVNRSLNGLLRVPAACNPLKTGWFAWQLISHKLLRWFSSFILVINLLAALAVASSPQPSPAITLLVAVYGISALLALAGWHRDLRGDSCPLSCAIPYYGMLMLLASLIGVLRRLQGDVIATWETARAATPSRDHSMVVLPWLLTGLATVCLLVLLPFPPLPATLQRMSALLLIGLILYIYLGYPLLLALLARLVPVSVRRDEQCCPTATLLIIAHNEERVIADKLNNSLQLEYPPERLRIVVASDGSTDSTNELVAAYAAQGVQLLAFAENRGKIAALNEAVSRINTDIVIFSDANVIYEPQALRRLMSNFADSSVGAVSGRVVLLNDTLSYGNSERLYYRIEHFIQQQEGALGALVGADGAMYAVRRELFRPPPDDTVLDDLVIAMSVARQGYRVMHEPEARGFEQNLHELRDEFRRKARIISGGFQYLLRRDMLPGFSQPLLLFNFVSHKLLRWLSGALFIPLLLLLVHIHVTPGLAQPFYSLALYGLGAALLLAACGQFVPAFRKITPINMLHYFFMLALASLVGLCRELGGGQQVTWRRGATPCAE